MRQTTVMGRGGAIALAVCAAAIGGCSPSPAALSLIFPDTQSRDEAVSVSLYVIRPSTEGMDECSQFTTGNPPVQPEDSPLHKDVAIKELPIADLLGGAAKSDLSAVPTGVRTVLVKVENAQRKVYLRGCSSTAFKSGAQISITLLYLVPPGPDLGADMPDDFGGDMTDIAMPPKLLTITVQELRLKTRLLSGVNITITDGTKSATPATTDAAGHATFDITALTPPLQITAIAPEASSAGVTYRGATSLFGIDPGTNTAMTLPIELDQPIPQVGQAFTMTVSNPVAAGTVTAYWASSHGLSSDPLQSGAATSAEIMAGKSFNPMIAGVNYRVASIQDGASQIFTPPAVISPGNTATGAQMLYSAPLQLTLVDNATTATTYNTSHTYAVRLNLPAPPITASIPLVPPTTVVANPPSATVPLKPLLVNGSAAVMGEVIGVGSCALPCVSVRGELRHIYDPAVDTPATDSVNYTAGWPLMLPIVSLPGGPITAATPVLIGAGNAFGDANFVHITVKLKGDPTKFYLWRGIAPVNTPITMPAMLPGTVAGNYDVSVSFVKRSVTTSTVATVLASDYSLLIRQIALKVSQRVVQMTVN